MAAEALSQSDERVFFCEQHWPASLRFNRARSASISADKRINEDGKSEASLRTKVEPGDLYRPSVRRLFADNPYNCWNTRNKNNLRCYTVRAYNY